MKKERKRCEFCNRIVFVFQLTRKFVGPGKYAASAMTGEWCSSIECLESRGVALQSRKRQKKKSSH